jgi:hypothetical protein
MPRSLGSAAFCSLIHVPDEALAGVLGQFRRVLRPGGPLLVGFHAGESSRLKTSGYGGHPMKVWVHRRRPASVAADLREAGFAVEAELALDPDGSGPGSDPVRTVPVLNHERGPSHPSASEAVAAACRLAPTDSCHRYEGTPSPAATPAKPLSRAAGHRPSPTSPGT